MMELFKSSGIISHFVEQQLSVKRSKISDNLPKALTVEQLEGTFRILFFGLLVACLIFLMEFCKHLLHMSTLVLATVTRAKRVLNKMLIRR